MTVCRPDLKLVVKLYGSVLPDYGYILRRCESEQRWIRFSPRLYQFVAHIQCQAYSELYQDEARIQSALLRAIFPNDEEIHQALRELTCSPPDEQQRLFNELLQDSINLGQWLEENVVHLQGNRAMSVFFRRSALRGNDHSNKRGAFVGVGCLCSVHCYSTDSKPRAGLTPGFPANDFFGHGCHLPRTAHPTPNVAGSQ